MQETSIATLDIARVRADFPILNREVNGKPLVYLDNGASSQKPLQVVEALDKYYKNTHSNVHRGVHTLSQEATNEFEAARETVRKYIGAAETGEVIFTKGTTEGINLVASSFGRAFLQEGDEVLISTMEHHSNIVPWQMICEERGAKLKVIPITDEGELVMEGFEQLLSRKTKIVSINHVSNSLGTINPVREVIAKAHAMDIPVMLDGAQAMPHMQIDVTELDCDFYAFSAHKMFGPTGMGVLYGKAKWLNAMPPYHGGGEMIRTVTFEKTTYNELPFKFEAGTPDIAGAIALAAAIDYVLEIGFDKIQAYEDDLLAYATAQMEAIPDMRFIGTAREKVGVISFLVGDIHPYDMGTILDKLGIAVRTGHHCTEPLMNRLGIPGTIRASFAFYNTREEVDILVAGIKRAQQMLG